MAKRSTYVRHRDTETGRFVSATKWRQSRSHGGTRYKRVSIPVPHPHVAGRKPPVTPTAPPSGGGISEPPTGREPAGPGIDLDDYFESGYEAPEEEEYA